MTRVQAADIGRTARWLLLACTVFGLATMHTVGHGMRIDAHPHTSVLSGTTPAATVTGLWPAALVQDVVAAPCPDDHCGSDHGGLAGWSVCLAVLGGLGLLIVIAYLLVHRGSGRPGGRPDAATDGQPSRGPPWSTAGLTAVSATVLRI